MTRRTPSGGCSRATSETDDGEIVYRVTATAFLRHMVRTIVGTLVEVGRHERSVEDFQALLVERDRTRAGPTAPPQGLCLMRVTYAAPSAADES